MPRRGIDVMRAACAVDFRREYAAGVRFVMLGAPCVHLIPAAVAAGLDVGIFCGADADADAVIRAALPHRESVTLWAACAVESPGEAEAAQALLLRLAESGFSPMVRAESAVLRRAPQLRRYPLWLCDWGVGEARALMENPRMRQYSREGGVGQNWGYF